MTVTPVPRKIEMLLDEVTRTLRARRRGSEALKRRGWLVRRALMTADLTGLCLSFALAQLLYAARTRAVGAFSSRAEIALFLLALPAWIVAAKLGGLYDRDEERADHSTTDDVAGVLQLTTIGTWFLYAGTYVIRSATPQFPKLFAFWVLAVISVPLLRALARAFCRRQVHYLQNTLIVGAGDVGQSIARKLIKHPEYGLNLVGFIDSAPKDRAVDIEHLSILGGLRQLEEVVRILDIERVIFAFSNDSSAESLRTIRKLNELDVQVDIVPRFFEVLGPGIDLHGIEGVALAGVRPPRLSRSSALLKRWLDVTAAVLGCAVLSPIFLVVALLIKLDSPGPIFFRQTRMGAGDKTFRILKFRSMTDDADAQKVGLAHLNKHLDGGDPRMFKIEADPRVTRVGRFLRSTSLDELPQLWNVLRGDMSLVGPRPLILSEHEHVSDWAGRRLDLRPGITGLWQVLGRDDIPFEEMVKLDYVYVTTWTLSGDLSLLLRTVPVVVACRGK
jgi:exopolysaccharide biosynthesis polyprenyl glycosylphosphotransferase